MRNPWKSYAHSGLFDECIDEKNKPRSYAKTAMDHLASIDSDDLNHRQNAAELAIKDLGITFTVYQEGTTIDRSWPLDILPRMIPSDEWKVIAKGLQQRVHALNLFIQDIYNEQNIIKDGIFPANLLKNSVNFRKECIGVTPPNGIWAHICGSDLVRDDDGTMYVLEDNLRVPSGVSYMIENRSVMKRVFPELFEELNVEPVSDYPSQLFDMLCAMSPRKVADPEVVVLTPGIYNSAYFEHSFLAQQMGCELVEGRDLVVNDDDCVYMRTIEGLVRVDVIYRRIDDLFLDPEAFDKDSMLGVPGLLRAWKAGNVALANAPGAGVADDKVVYAYVPAIIEYYLKQKPIIPNVPTYKCEEPEDREYVLANLDKLVVKPANESGGYGLLIGPKSTKKERAEFTKRINKDPRNYVAQPTLNLSCVPTLTDDGIEPRHVDLRPFILSSGNGKGFVTTGGLTRVALVKGSLVVNSSQGGGSKDTWVIKEKQK